jgi:hypothetical protein
MSPADHRDDREGDSRSDGTDPSTGDDLFHAYLRIVAGRNDEER